MSDIENQSMSLADIAGLDVTTVAELRMENLAEGLFIFEAEAGILGERENDEGEKKYGAQLKFKVLEVQAVMDRNVDPESLVGKTHTEFRSIDPAEAQKGIGYLKGFIADIGCDNTGSIGGLPEEAQPEGYVPGFLDKMAGHRFTAKIIHRKDKQGNVRANMKAVAQQ